MNISTKIKSYLFEIEEVGFNFLLFFRVSIGMLCLVHFLAIIQDFDQIFGLNGLFPSEVNELQLSQFDLSFYKIQILTGISPTLLMALFKTSFICLCLLIVFGLFSRLSAFLLLILHAVMVHSNILFVYGVDFFTSMSLFYLVFFPVQDNATLLTGLKLKRTSNNYLFFRRMLQFHLLLVYAFGGFDKIIGYNWWNGESMWKAITLPYANLDFPIELSFLGSYPTMLAILGWSVVLLELLYPIGMMYKRSRKYWLIAIIGMHLGIGLLLNLYFFSAIMIILNIAAFYNFQTTRKGGLNIAET